MGRPAATRLAFPPPPPPAVPRRPGALAAYAAGAGAVLAIIIARAMVDGRIVYPGCGFRWATGLPCPGCGGTHALAALGGGHPLAAVAHNPLVALIAAAMVVLALAAGLDALINRGRLILRLSARGRGTARRAGWWMLVAVVVNWIFLLVVAW